MDQKKSFDIEVKVGMGRVETIGTGCFGMMVLFINTGEHMNTP